MDDLADRSEDATTTNGSNELAVGGLVKGILNWGDDGDRQANGTGSEENATANEKSTKLALSLDIGEFIRKATIDQNAIYWTYPGSLTTPGKNTIN